MIFKSSKVKLTAFAHLFTERGGEALIPEQ